MNQESVSPLEHDLTAALAINGIGQRVPLPFSPANLVQEQIVDIRLAASKMSGPQRSDSEHYENPTNRILPFYSGRTPASP
jgi:hypothetical protein